MNCAALNILVGNFLDYTNSKSVAWRLQISETFDERVLILKFGPDPSSRSADISRTIFLEPLNAMGFHGCKLKQKHNTAGLRNHKPANTTSKSSPVLPQSPPAPAASSDDEWETHLYTEDGLKAVPDSNIDSEMEPEGEDDYTLDSVYLDDKVFLENLLMQADDVGDAVSDDDEWVLCRVHYERQHRKQKARGSYKKGPDIGSKSDRTNDAAGVHPTWISVALNPKPLPPSNVVESMNQADGEEPGADLLNTEGTASNVDMFSVHSGRSGAMSADEFDVEGPIVEEPNDDEASVDVSDAADSQPSSHTASPSPDKEGIHEWEMEAEFDTLGFKALEKIKDWAELRELELKKKGKGLPVSKMNRLTIIRNCATLRLKGFGCMTASKARGGRESLCSLSSCTRTALPEARDTSSGEVQWCMSFTEHPVGRDHVFCCA
ncbi:hypothetical protein DFH09DRAFT_1074573 [Mycena vulgaris]|nr:hypothetical protein DFH09DRAFT_1074573 [Mycena vulgaris]